MGTQGGDGIPLCVLPQSATRVFCRGRYFQLRPINQVPQALATRAFWAVSRCYLGGRNSWKVYGKCILLQTGHTVYE